MTTELQYDIRPERLPEKLQPLAEEICTYFRELPKLLDEGQEGKVALIKGRELFSVWDTYEDASQAGADKFALEKHMTQTIREQDLDELAKFFLSEEARAELLVSDANHKSMRTDNSVSPDRRSIMRAEVEYDIRPERVPAHLQTLAEEICTYFREGPRLLDEGQEGKVALIKGSELFSVWDTFEDAMQAGVDRFGIVKFMAQPIISRDLDELAKYFLPEEKRASA